MFSTLFQVTSFKRALILCKEGKFAEAEGILKGLQDEFMALCEENEALKLQLSEVADVLDLADKVQFDGQKYWLVEDGEKKVHSVRSAMTAMVFSFISRNTKTTGNVRAAGGCI